MYEKNNDFPKKKIKKLILTGCTKIIAPYIESPKVKDQRKIIIKLYNYYVREKNKIYSRRYLDTVYKLLYNNNGEKEIIGIRNKLNFKNINKINLYDSLYIKHLPNEMNFIKIPRNRSVLENKIKIRNIHIIPKNDNLSKSVPENKEKYTQKNNNNNKLTIKKITFKKSKVNSCIDINRRNCTTAKLKTLQVSRTHNKMISAYSAKPLPYNKLILSAKFNDKNRQRNKIKNSLFSANKNAYDSYIKDNIILGKTNDKNRISRLLLSSAIYVRRQRELYLSQEMRRFKNLSHLNAKTNKLNPYPNIF